MREMMPRGRASTVLLLLLLCDCGAKTGLPVPDLGDANAGDAKDDGSQSDAPYTCVAGTFPLSHAQAELVLLLDRSGSMQSSMDGSSGTRRWDDLHAALAATLPEFQGRINLGAMAYPRRFDASRSGSCAIDRELHVEPGPMNARAVLALLESTDPSGATPTRDAVQFVGKLLSGRVSRDKTQSIVLATDGGPNCNPTLDGKTCPCTGADTCASRPSNCLDKERTVETIADIARRGVPTFVIGLDSLAVPFEREALEAMAIAGGRPNIKPGALPYYSVRDPTAVTDAFRTIQKSIVQCRLSIPSRPDDPAAVTVTLDGKLVPRDPSHADGWDWASRDFGQIDFFGSACERVGLPGAAPMATVLACRDAG